MQVRALSVPWAQDEQPGEQGTQNPWRMKYPETQVVQVSNDEQVVHWAWRQVGVHIPLDDNVKPDWQVMHWEISVGEQSTQLGVLQL